MPAGNTFRLTMSSGPTPGRVFELTQEVITLGRDVSNEVVVNDAEVSRQHTRLTRQLSGYSAEDLGSTNGTTVNGARLTGPRPLNPGDQLGLGDNVSLLYEAVADDSQATVIKSPPVWAPPPMAETATEAFSVPPSIEPLAAEPPVEMAAPSRGAGAWRWALAGCGCLLILTCFAVFGGLVYYIDANNLYCEWLRICP